MKILPFLFIASLITTSTLAQMRGSGWVESAGIFGDPTVDGGKVRLSIEIKSVKKNLGGIPGISRMEDTVTTSLICWCTDDIDIQEPDGKKFIPKEVYAKNGVQDFLLDNIGVLNTYVGRKVAFTSGGRNGECKQLRFLKSEAPKPSAKDASKELSVLEIQKLLKAKGYDPGAVDGKMGSKTISAIKEFQKANNLRVTGKVDQETRKLLTSKN